MLHDRRVAVEGFEPLRVDFRHGTLKFLAVDGVAVRTRLKLDACVAGVRVLFPQARVRVDVVCAGLLEVYVVAEGLAGAAVVEVPQALH